MTRIRVALAIGAAAVGLAACGSQAPSVRTGAVLSAALHQEAN